MKSAKEYALAVLEQVPEEASMEEILGRLWLNAKILRSIEFEERGELIPHEQVMEELDQWLQSLGHDPRAKTSTP